MFCAVIASDLFILSESLPKPNYQHQQNDGLCIRIMHSFKPKPVDDSFWHADERGYTLFEGVLVSGQNLTNPDSQEQTICEVLQQEKHRELASFHGQFACLVYEQAKQELRVYSDNSNNFRVYYHHQPGIFITATSIKLILDLLTLNNLPYHPDEIGLRMMLSYGYMLRDWTTIAEVRQLGAAKYIRHTLQGTEHQAYFRYDASIRFSDKLQITTELTKLFRLAVDDAFNRDGNQRHFAFISGGLDSRMVLWTAHELGYKPIDCLNFSQPGYLDQTIATQICNKLGCKLSFFSLEDGNYLKDLDDNLSYHEAQIVLHGAAHLYSAIKTMNLTQYGIMHSGQIGDVIKGSYLQARGHTPVNLMAGAYSTRLLPSILQELDKYKADYPTHELFILENRGFNCITNGDLACLELGYSVSPFVEPQFMQFALNVDPALRAGAMMYLYWMRHSYPEASRFRWEKFNCPVTTPYLLARLQYNLWRGSDKILRMLTHKPNTLNMNPFDYWWSTNPSLRQQFSPKFAVPDDIRHLLSPELIRDTETMFVQGSLSEKFQAYSAVRGIQHLFSNEGKL